MIHEMKRFSLPKLGFAETEHVHRLRDRELTLSILF
jgi:hypothetical protein